MLKTLKIAITVLLLAASVLPACSSNPETGNLKSDTVNYYVNPETGSADGDGTMKRPFKFLAQISSLSLKPGDSILLAAGTISRGSVELKNVTGSAERPIVISSYQPGQSSGNERAAIDAKGTANGILLENCSFIEVSRLELSANAGPVKMVDGKLPDMRCGILVKTTGPGTFGNITLSSLIIKDVFYEEEGYIRGKDEVRSANGTQSYGWGIRFINQTDGALLKNLKVEDCEISNVAHTGIKFTGKGKIIENISVLNNRVTATGGPGIQMSGVLGGLVKGNSVDRSGSNDDSRKWGRGSGLWTWGTDNVLIEHNSFLNANGPGDSAGCHIDFNCKNVVVQYNLSANNAGGFCEILGNNHNCAYRYNISVNDGWRVKGKDGAFQEGKIFWLSGYVGEKQTPKGPFNSYFYNNTMYVSKEIAANFAVSKSSSGILIANNIFYIEGEGKLVPGDQYQPEAIGSKPIDNTIFENNLYLSGSNWPKEVLIQDGSPVIGNPQFQNKGGLKIVDYIPDNIDLIKDRGMRITKIPNDSVGLTIGLDVKKDILGNAIKGLPDMGAIEL
jgi:hypothetical protein